MSTLEISCHADEHFQENFAPSKENPMDISEVMLWPDDDTELSSSETSTTSASSITSQTEDGSSTTSPKLTNITLKARDILQQSKYAKDLAIFIESTEPGYVMKLRDNLAESMHVALESSQTQMLPTFIEAMPTGQEKGAFIALDLGGSTLRLAVVRLLGNRQQPEVHYAIEEKVTSDIKQLRGKQFFNWICSRVRTFYEKGIENEWFQSFPVKLGVTWSFPMAQTATDSATIMAMGKGYTVGDDLIGLNLKDCFEEPFKEFGMDIVLSAIINDTTAAMLSRAYCCPETSMGLILGTGCNMAVKLPKATIGDCKLTSHPKEWLKKDGHCAINAEISMFGKDILPVTVWDKQLDESNEKPGYQPLECMVSGRYLGEICRIILVDLFTEGLLFAGKSLPKNLDTLYGMESETLSNIEKLSDEDAKEYFLQQHPCKDLEVSDIQLIRSICILVSSRAAAIVAAAVLALSSVIDGSRLESFQGKQKHSVAFVGSVISKYHTFSYRCQSYCDLLNNAVNTDVHLQEVDDGSIVGASVAAAINNSII